MPNFKISIVNQTFESHNERDLPTVERARSEAIKSALQIGMSEVGEAHPFFGAEVSVGGDGERPARFVVSMGVSQLR